MSRKYITIPANETFKQIIKDYFGTDEGKKNEIIDLYGYISTWDTSLVTDMSGAFKGLHQFHGRDPKLVCAGNQCSPADPYCSACFEEGVTCSAADKLVGYSCRCYTNYSQTLI